MEAKLPARLGVAIMLIAAVCFATNHVGARVAFDLPDAFRAAVMGDREGKAAPKH